MRKRYSIYPNPELDRVLEDRAVGATDNEERSEPLRGRSATITSMCTRYAEAVRQHTPNFSVPEWLMICDSLNGYWTNDDPQLAAHGVAMNIADNSALSSADQQFGVNGIELAERIQKMSFIESIAIMDVVERFWTGGAMEGEDYEALFKRLAWQLPRSLDADRGSQRSKQDIS